MHCTGNAEKKERVETSVNDPHSWTSQEWHGPFRERKLNIIEAPGGRWKTPPKYPPSGQTHRIGRSAIGTDRSVRARPRVRHRILHRSAGIQGEDQSKPEGGTAKFLENAAIAVAAFVSGECWRIPNRRRTTMNTCPGNEQSATRQGDAPTLKVLQPENATTAADVKPIGGVTKTIAEKLANRTIPPTTRIETPPALSEPDNPDLDWYSSAQQAQAGHTVTLDEFISIVRSDDHADTVEAIRRMVASGDKDGTSAAKKKLPAVSLSGCCSSGGRQRAVEQGRFVHSGLLQIDIDGLNGTLDEVRGKLMSDPHMQAVFVTPSGNGVKGVMRIPADATRHLDSFLAAESHWRRQGLTIDPATKDPARLCFVSHDPDAWIRPDEAQVFQPPVKASGLVIRNDGNDLTLEDLAEMLVVIPKQAYTEWLQIASGAWNHFGEDATKVLASVWPEDVEGEYADKFQHRLKDFSIGTVWKFATDNGWQPSRRLKTIRKAMQEDKDVENIISGSSTTTFSPPDVYYEAPTGKYLIQCGSSYLTFSRVTPVLSGLMRHFAPDHSKPDDIRSAAVEAIRNRELDGAVQWAGSIAGHRQGMTTDVNGLPMLIVSEANPPVPSKGDWDVIDAILGQAFGEALPLKVFISWLATRYRSVIAHTHMPAPMMVLAGEVNSGKSLLAWIVAQCLGGRTANPYSAWTGEMAWNDDLFGSELLLIDDCVGSTDVRSRKNLGTSFKEAIYANEVQMRKRNVSSISVRPVWSVMICCNDNAESLQIIPPLTPDMSDKVIMIRVGSITTPIDTSTPDGRLKLQAAIRAELPAFLRFLSNWVIPDDIRDSRSGVLAWRDPSLVDAVESSSNEHQLEELIHTSIKRNPELWGSLPKPMTSSEIKSILLDPHSAVREQARPLLNWSAGCGVYLSRLADGKSRMLKISQTMGHKKTNRFSISIPNFITDGDE